MIIVIQCASSKVEQAGTFVHDGRPVEFVAHPPREQSPSKMFAHPDDPVPGGARTWREVVVESNRSAQPQNMLLQAATLYQAPAYKRLIQELPLDRIFILSAGWGLIRGDFRIPRYDITFSTQAAPIHRRSKRDVFLDFNHLGDQQPGPSETIHFFGGSSYLPLYLSMTSAIPCRKIIHYKSETTTIPIGYQSHRYLKPGNTNWHYGAIQDFLNQEENL